MKQILLLVAVISLVGCAAPSQVMVEPQSWKQAGCSAMGIGLGSAVAMHNYTECVKKLKAMGYQPAEEVIAKEGRKFVAQNNSNAQVVLKPVLHKNMEWEYEIESLSVKSTAYRFVEKKDIYKGKTIYVMSEQYGDALPKRVYYDENLGLHALLDKNGNIAEEFIPPQRPYDWPLKLGHGWMFSTDSVRPSGTLKKHAKFAVKGYGKVKVKAGTFDAYYVLGTSVNEAFRLAELWYSPEVKNYVKAVFYKDGGKVTEELSHFNLDENKRLGPTENKTKIVKKVVTINPHKDNQKEMSQEQELERKLIKLKELRRKELISEEEFKQKKSELLSNY